MAGWGDEHILQKLILQISKRDTADATCYKMQEKGKCEGIVTLSSSR